MVFDEPVVAVSLGRMWKCQIVKLMPGKVEKLQHPTTDDLVRVLDQNLVLEMVFDEPVAEVSALALTAKCRSWEVAMGEEPDAIRTNESHRTVQDRELVVNTTIAINIINQKTVTGTAIGMPLLPSSHQESVRRNGNRQKQWSLDQTPPKILIGIPSRDEVHLAREVVETLGGVRLILSVLDLFMGALHRKFQIKRLQATRIWGGQTKFPFFVLTTVYRENPLFLLSVMAMHSIKGGLRWADQVACQKTLLYPPWMLIGIPSRPPCLAAVTYSLRGDLP
mmetsp:Transcript_9350/g.17013  ORF Transcript_9350/g.17013 Transcript_9350/m.17013 type:complete len:279 (+) Transcript_9350:2-838(+)